MFYSNRPFYRNLLKFAFCAMAFSIDFYSAFQLSLQYLSCLKGRQIEWSDRNLLNFVGNKAIVHKMLTKL